MVLSSRIFSAHIVISIWLLIGCSMTNGTETDIFCLKGIKESLEDPNNYLQYSWDFNNNTEGFICRFTGVECWHDDENKVLNLNLSSMGLKGQFPRALQNCSSLTGLDLSKNNLSGTIPADIPKLLPYVTTLYLSSNHFSGEIPVGLADCSYLNKLKLDQNRLSGQIPPQLGWLSRIKRFNVTNNRLRGQVPSFGSVNIPTDSYANNPGLCGAVALKPCQVKSTKNNMTNAVIVGAVVGGVISAALGLGIAMLLDEEPVGNKGARNLKGAIGIKTSNIARTTSLRLPITAGKPPSRPLIPTVVRPPPVWAPNPLRPPHPLKPPVARMHDSRETVEAAIAATSGRFQNFMAFQVSTSKENSQAPSTSSQHV